MDNTTLSNAAPPPGWVGGFPQSNPKFAYPHPDLTSLPMLDNMANISKLQRQMKILWPEFSWETQPGKSTPQRCYQMFAPDISRIGYTDEGRVYSIMCPQQGLWLKDILCLNVEVTVTSQRGWVDEPNKRLAADMTVEGKIWFTPRDFQSDLVKRLWNDIDKLERRGFPFSKANALRVATSSVGTGSDPIFPVLDGPSDRFTSPDFAKHQQVAYTLGHIDVQIDQIIPTNDPLVDKFNTIVLQLFNLGSGNMLLQDTVLSWNVWFDSPELVDQKEWADHAELWRKSIDAHHGSPEGEGTQARFFDGTYFKPTLSEGEIKAAVEKLGAILAEAAVEAAGWTLLGWLKKLWKRLFGG
jgi:hypothetical protein